MFVQQSKVTFKGKVTLKDNGFLILKGNDWTPPSLVCLLQLMLRLGKIKQKKYFSGVLEQQDEKKAELI